MNNKYRSLIFGYITKIPEIKYIELINLNDTELKIYFLNLISQLKKKIITKLGLFNKIIVFLTLVIQS